jgi:hypothetical protein
MIVLKLLKFRCGIMFSELIKKTHTFLGFQPGETLHQVHQRYFRLSHLSHLHLRGHGQDSQGQIILKNSRHLIFPKTSLSTYRSYGCVQIHVYILAIEHMQL